MLEQVCRGPADPMFWVKQKADADDTEQKVDLGVGIYRNELGKYQEFDVIKSAKLELARLDLGHDYASTIGDAEFLHHGANMLFGESCDALRSGRISAVQTISGTGANWLGASLLADTFPTKQVYIATPGWGNHVQIFQGVGLETVTYPYLDSTYHSPDVHGLMNTIRTAPQGSVFLFQGCCHNPTGVDFSLQQWRLIAQEMKANGHLAFVDIAYQGLGEGLDEDAAGLRTLVDEGLEMLVCQSFSKNFALYGERCGALYAVSQTSTIASNVQDKLRSLIRRSYSSSPAYGSRLVKIVLNDESQRTLWVQELESMRSRLGHNRRKLVALLNRLQISGDWSHVIQERGLFSCLALNAYQCRVLVDKYHVHLPENGRINVAGLNENNLAYTAKAIASVLRSTQEEQAPSVHL